MRLIILIAFLLTFSVQTKENIGPDKFLNERASFMCKQIAESKTPIDQMNWQQALELTSKRGLEAANKSVKHLREFEKKGIHDHDEHIYSGYINMYLLQACQDYDRFFAIVDRNYLNNKLQRKRFIETHRFVRDFMLAKNIINIENYFENNRFNKISSNLNPYFNSLQKIRWTSSILVYSTSQTPNKFIVNIIDINDINHNYEIEIDYGNNVDSKISTLKINEYTKKNPKLEVKESIDITPNKN